jgi:hypothetical protein
MDKLGLQNKLSRIPGVIGANITITNDEINEVHVLADDSRKAKEIMLDTKSLLSVELQRAIDFRIISVAQLNKEEAMQKQTNLFQPPRLVLLAAYIGVHQETVMKGLLSLNSKVATSLAKRLRQAAATGSPRQSHELCAMP